MTLKSYFVRARRGIREEARLYVAAVTTLTVAFVCLATVILGVTNFARLADRWGRTHRMTVYLEENAARDDVGRLEEVLRGLPAVKTVKFQTAAEAKIAFLADAHADAMLAELPVEVFPSTIEVEFQTAVLGEKIAEISAKVGSFKAAVAEVDTYESWFRQLSSLLSLGRNAAFGMAGLVLVCVFAVVANTIRLAVANRRDEIELLRMCGATDGFVRGPFLVEGGLQGLASASGALAIVAVAHLLLRSRLNEALVPFAGIELDFLHPWIVVGLVGGGTLIGTLGALLAVRRYIEQ
jgi:cell division transport system permease protein